MDELYALFDIADEGDLADLNESIRSRDLCDLFEHATPESVIDAFAA